MTLNQIVQAYQRWLFTPQAATPLGIYRILIGLHVILYACLLAPELLIWYGTDGILSPGAAHAISAQLWINPLCFTPFTNNDSITCFFAVFCIAALFMTLGLCTRASTFVVWFCLVAFYNRSPISTNGADRLLYLACFYLMMSPAGEYFSLDRIIRVWTRKDGDKNASRLYAPWPLRLLQLQFALVYVGNFVGKAFGAEWLNGTGVYYATHQSDIARFPLPIGTDNLLVSKILTWYALLTEGAMCTLVWIKDLRYAVLLAAAILHLGIDYALELPGFETLMICSLIVFVYPEDLAAGMARLQAILNKGLEPLKILYDGANLRCYRLAETLRRLDILKRLRFVDSQQSKAFAGQESFDTAAASGTLSVFADGRWFGGKAALHKIARQLGAIPRSKIEKKSVLSCLIIFYCYAAFLIACPRSWHWAIALKQPIQVIGKFIGSYYELNLFTPNPSQVVHSYEFAVKMDDGTTKLWTWPNEQTLSLDRDLYVREFEVMMRFANNTYMSPYVAQFVARQCDTPDHHPLTVGFIQTTRRILEPGSGSNWGPETKSAVYTYRIGKGAPP